MKKETIESATEVAIASKSHVDRAIAAARDGNLHMAVHELDEALRNLNAARTAIVRVGKLVIA